MDPVHLLRVNGALVLAAGVLAGGPYYLAIVLGWPADRARAWRVAHATLLADGLLLLVAGLLLPDLALAAPRPAVLAWSLAVSGWAFTFALAGGALAGRRGLTPLPPGWETLFFAGHAAGALGTIAGVGLLLAGVLAR